VETPKVTAMMRIAFSLAAAAAVLCLYISPSQAQYFGDAPWCAVTAMGTGGVHYDCEYNNVEACVPNVLAGNRGFCALNPYYGHGTGNGSNYGSAGWQEHAPLVTHHRHYYYPHYSRYQSHTSPHQPHPHSHKH
jgi:hypothetical protein